MNGPAFNTDYLVHPDGDDCLHVYPDPDDREHEFSIMCPCNPKLKVNNGISIVRHYSFAGKKDTEEQLRQLGELESGAGYKQ